MLGLIGDEQYAEVLRLVAEKDTGAVFPLVDGLVNSGADLAEFMTGTAELLRALLMVQSGATPDGLTEVMRTAIERVRGVLLPADIVRMLALLAEAEISIRRSASARLVVETLLLRWTLMDRVVEIEAMIQGIPQGVTLSRSPERSEGEAKRPSSAPSAASQPQGDTRAPSPQPPVPSLQPPAASTQQLSLPALLSIWPQVLDAATEKSRLLGQALTATTPVAAGSGEVRLSATADDAMLTEGVRRQLGAVEEILAVRFLGPIKVRLVVEAPSGGLAERPKRMTDEILRAERLERLRRVDPALDTAANELDLEIVDEG